MYTTCVAQAVHTKYCTGTSTACEPKHADLRTVSASSRLSMPKYCTSTVRTYKHKHKHKHSCTLRTTPRLPISYTVRVQVQHTSPSTWAYAQSVHRPGCSCQSQAVQAKTLSKNSAYVQAQAPMYTTYVAQAVHASTRTMCTPEHAGLRAIVASPRLFMPNHCTSGTSTVRTYKQSTHVYYVRRPDYPCHILYTHAYTYSQRVV